MACVPSPLLGHIAEIEVYPAAAAPRAVGFAKVGYAGGARNGTAVAQPVVVPQELKRKEEPERHSHKPHATQRPSENGLDHATGLYAVTEGDDLDGPLGERVEGRLRSGHAATPPPGLLLCR